MPNFKFIKKIQYVGIFDLRQNSISSRNGKASGSLIVALHPRLLLEAEWTHLGQSIQFDRVLRDREAVADLAEQRFALYEVEAQRWRFMISLPATLCAVAVVSILVQRR